MILPLPESNGQRQALAMALAIIGSVALIALMKGPGLFFAFGLVIATYVMVRSRPDATEHRTLRSSIRLSAEDVSDIIAEYDMLAHSDCAEAIADRTLHRPALYDVYCDDPDIEAFHFQCDSARRYLDRLQLRLDAPDLEIPDLERLLTVTDDRAVELREAWLAARRAAFRLGPSYGDATSA